MSTVSKSTIIRSVFPEGGAAGQSGTYKVVWRNGQDVGAKFVSAVTQNA